MDCHGAIKFWKCIFGYGHSVTPRAYRLGYTKICKTFHTRDYVYLIRLVIDSRLRNAITRFVCNTALDTLYLRLSSGASPVRVVAHAPPSLRIGGGGRG